MENQIMASNIKTMFKELLAEHEKLQEKHSEKQMQFYENTQKMNNMVKKKVKEHEDFKKNLFVSLQEVFARAPKKIRKDFVL